ncbi:hypothetical protein AB0L88_26310 [Saccharopolyspora shandongensis]|uniref:Uncharacterized protein n=1 Tax=Saccharopolyspora shandongensis TaxID=418495 RepID=A0A1H3ILP6_9PSEU|nr:hypothetical protein [Saccharopolyspora shandongensis]SDY28620.1 hypothetical protein SAMN05216215_102348 [Saccharopolyspora shandongensis]
MAEELKGLDYFLASDAWKGTKVADWSMIDAFVDHGWLTDQDRKYLHAYGSMVALSPDSSGGFSETDAAWKKYLEVKDEHEDDPQFNDDTKAEDIPPPDWDDGPQDGKDYHKDTPFDVPGDEKTPVGDVPKVPGDDGEKKGGKGVISVNTKALAVFADNVESLRVMISNAKKKTDQVNVLPGGFNLAFKLRDKIMGTGDKDPGLKTNVRNYMDGLDIALANVRDEVRKLIVDYDSTEELNKLTTDKLNKVMRDSFSFIDSSSRSK